MNAVVADAMMTAATLMVRRVTNHFYNGCLSSLVQLGNWPELLGARTGNASKVVKGRCGQGWDGGAGSMGMDG